MIKEDLKNVKDLRDKADILELDKNIQLFKGSEIEEERFKQFRLTRGVYGQRQLGVHMFRTKFPMGKISGVQLEKLADISETYATGNLHLTTRQNIQFHYVKLEDSVEIWKLLAETGMNAREACGNTVRNVTCSAKAGIDPDEPFDVSPYAFALYRHFLRNPICQEMGRKIKIAFSSSEKDSAYAYFHDFGFIPKIKKGIRGFRVLIGGGLGAQSIVAPEAYEFLEANKIIPFTEAAVRVFDRMGEREKRFKARMKFLVKKLGVEKFLSLVHEEMKAVPVHSIEIPYEQWIDAKPASLNENLVHPEPEKEIAFIEWKNSNTGLQKNGLYHYVQLKVRLGDIDAPTARKLAKVIRKYAADDIRITVNQGFLLRYVHPDALYSMYLELQEIELADPGFGSIMDITACPGTDTCNLGVSNSTALAVELENIVISKYPELTMNKDIQIKISGCMNSCGQHMASAIGFHGSSFKVNNRIAPAMQVLMGGGVDEKGNGFIGERIIKIPTKKAPTVLIAILDHYYENKTNGENFNDFYYRNGRRYFYDFLKPFSDLEQLTDEDYRDWGDQSDYIQAIGVGECAGASFDMVSTIIQDARERVRLAEQESIQGNWAAAIYYSYSSMVIAAKALLLSEDIKCNTHKGIIEDFQSNFIDSEKLLISDDFVSLCNAIKINRPTEIFSKSYLIKAVDVVEKMTNYRNDQLAEFHQDKKVVSDYYKA